ncbi:MAG TPA: glycoside hydrolase family 52 protein [Tepidisphaeraceae bacterium]|nr:glycoside hydrolase family 52 protein [Tepidisphaeraceae bacterium]
MLSDLLPFPGNFNFNAQHSPMGAYMSFTCGHFQSSGGIGLEIGKPANQNIYIGVKDGDRRSPQPIRCLPFFKGGTELHTPASSYEIEESAAAAPRQSTLFYPSDQIRRLFGWASDCWQTPDFKFSIYTPFSPIPEPSADSETLKACLLPAVIATLEVDNRQGHETKTAVFAIDFVEPGARILEFETPGSDRPKLGFAWRRNMGVLGRIESNSDKSGGEFIAVQRWLLAEALTDPNPIHALGTCAGLAMEVPPGVKKTLVLAIGVHLDGIVTTGLEGRYYYTRYYTNLDEVLAAALDRAADLQTSAAVLDARLLNSGLSSDQQFLIAHGTRSYYGSTQLLDVGGEPLWIVNEGEYCMMNTLDLSVDHAFWELKHNPWVVRNILNQFARRYSYHDQVKSVGGQLRPGGISFCHDMGINNNFSSPGNSSYELSHLKGCFSYMTQEQLCNWVVMAVSYVAATRDIGWLLGNKHLFDACAQSMLARANQRSGLMAYDSARCAEGREITTYDSLDESLGQARANTYLATKCWATWLALDLVSRLRFMAGDIPAEPVAPLAEQLASTLITSATDGLIPAVLEKNSPGYHSRILPVIESLIYPVYWLSLIRTWPSDLAGDAEEMLTRHLQSPLISVLRQHALKLLTDRDSPNLFPDGGLKLSSTSNNSWMSKIAIVQYVARSILRLAEADPRIDGVMSRADAAHVKWQTDGSAYWACSDQFVAGEAKGSRYYPRIITAALWLEESVSSRRVVKAPEKLSPVAVDRPR